ncbi:MAG: Rap1a/Tai family immunity protein [Burkholderiales bacterium]
MSATLRLALAGALLLAAGGGSAADVWLYGKFTGEEMLRYCKSLTTDEAVRDFEKGVCTGFIDGFAAGHRAAELWHIFHHRDEKIDHVFGHLCVPNNANRAALAIVFVRFLEKNLDKLNWNAGLLLESALREAFPCPEKK